jgi:hypothetical protein
LEATIARSFSNLFPRKKKKNGPVKGKSIFFFFLAFPFLFGTLKSAANHIPPLHCPSGELLMDAIDVVKRSP